MNIQQAKEEIKHTLQAYLEKDETGSYRYAPVHQRPILLMGPPGVGKTAVMEQAARECGVGLVAYAMTHHTRQSAIGLPRIENWDGPSGAVPITRYTLSEIIASIYETMERTGCKEGILFLDEINCVSETLTPVMLQLLQNKTFGMHQVPQGWIIVAAGNPPQYNRAAREFDLVTLDRVRRIDIEPDLGCWLSYAEQRGVHGAVCSYLRVRPDRFYLAQSNAQTLQFVTPRGWEDLSVLLQSYERLGLEVSALQTGQFLGDERVAREFAGYYGMYRKSGADYGLEQIVAGTQTTSQREASLQLARQGGFEERMAVTTLLLEHLKQLGETWQARTDLTEMLRYQLGRYREGKEETLGSFVDHQLSILETRRTQEILPGAEEVATRQALLALEQLDGERRKDHIPEGEPALAYLTERIAERTREAADEGRGVSEGIARAIAFLQEAFDTDQEQILLVSGVARSKSLRRAVTAFGCEVYTQAARLLA